MKDKFGRKKYTKPKSKILDNDFWMFYNKKVDKRYKIHRYTTDRITRKFLKAVSYNLVNNPSGVFLDGLGYFYVHENYNIQIFGFNKTKRYEPTFYPIKKSPLKNFSFDFRFNRILTKAIDKRVRNGARYLNWISAYK